MLKQACVALAFFVLGTAASHAAEEGIKLTGRQFFALSAANAAETAAWYQRAFGVKQLHEIKLPDGSVHVLILGSDTLLLEIIQLREATSPGAEGIRDRHKVHGIFKVGMYVADLDQAFAHLRAMNAEFDTQIVDDKPTGLRFVIVRDNSGNLVQLFDGGAGQGKSG